MSSPNEQDDLYQIAILIDQLKHDDLQFRVTASRNMCKIAKCLGPERTREELIPFLGESNDDDDDEVLQIIAEKLGELVDYVGGKEFAFLLLEPLESLVSVEEPKVRDSAVAAIKNVAGSMSNDHLKNYYVPLVARLAKRDSFTSRTSAISLFHACYERLTEDDKALMKQLFLKLCVDETPTVRRTAAHQFVMVLSKLNNEDKKDFLSKLSLLVSDDQDSVRIQSVSSYILLSNILEPDSYCTDVLPIVIKAANDVSWRVRRSVASQLHIFLAFVNDEKSKISLSDVYTSLLNDAESEVRATSSASLNSIAKHFSKEIIIERFVPQLQKIAQDPSENVRSSLANALNDVAVLIGKDCTIESILPTVLALLRDEVSEVRLSVISNLDKLNDVIGVEILGQSLVPAITQLTEDSSWRVRASIIEHMPMLAQHFGPNFFKEKLNTVCLNLLKDNVFNVRRAAAQNIQHIGLKMGDIWMSTEILPFIQKLQIDSSYTNRLTALKCFQLLLTSIKTENVRKIVLTSVTNMLTDNVPNIRFTAIKTLQQQFPLKVDIVIEVKTSIAKLVSDPDRDVRFFAKQAVKDIML